MALPNLFLDDLTTCGSSDLQQAIVNLAQSGVEEKFRLDFKETWDPDKQCPDIVAFANSYGGLLVLGVANDRKSFPGIPIPPKSDFKTQIASTIASRISPVPLFEVHTCESPSSATNALAIIRISAQPKVHMYLKGDRPVYVRNEDASVPARAPELRALLDRVRDAGSNPSSADRQRTIARDFFITRASNLANPLPDRATQRNRFERFLRVDAVPERALTVGLDAIAERTFVDALHKTYPNIAKRYFDTTRSRITEGDDRGGSWYRFTYRDVERDHDALWALNNEGIIQFMCECEEIVGDRRLWSMVDFFINLNGSVRLAHDIWKSLNYFGDGYFRVELSARAENIHMERNLYYPSLFYQTEFLLPINIAPKNDVDYYPVAVASAEAVLSYEARTTRAPHSLASLANMVLREFRFAVNLSELTDAFANLLERI